MEELSDKDDQIVKNVAGAGILLYMARKRVHGPGLDIQFVLAQEEFVNGWNQSGCWSAFEGGSHAGESVERTAAREFVEESAGGISINGYRTIDEVETMLKEKRFMCRVTVTQGRQRRAHVTFVVRIPWGTPVIAQFNSNRQYLVRLQNLTLTMEKLTKCLQKESDEAEMDKIILKLKKTREATVEALSKQPENFGAHGAITKLPYSERGPIVKISNDFIEKRQVNVIPDYIIRETLMKAERGEMNSKKNRFRLRYCFMPVLQHVVGMFDSR